MGAGEPAESQACCRKSTELLKRGPDVHMAARSGDPAMTAMRPTVPASVPVPAGTQAGFTGDVTAAVSTRYQRVAEPAGCAHESARTASRRPDAQPAATTPAACTARRDARRPLRLRPATTQLDTSLPTNAAGKAAKEQKKKKVKKDKKQQQQARAPATRGYAATAATPPPAQRLMARILLADDSPHAQRMGERILREEGFEVVSLTDGETTLLRLGRRRSRSGDRGRVSAQQIRARHVPLRQGASAAPPRARGTDRRLAGAIRRRRGQARRVRRDPEKAVRGFGGPADHQAAADGSAGGARNSHATSACSAAPVAGARTGPGRSIANESAPPLRSRWTPPCRP